MVDPCRYLLILTSALWYTWQAGHLVHLSPSPFWQKYSDPLGLVKRRESREERITRSWKHHEQLGYFNKIVYRFSNSWSLCSEKDSAVIADYSDSLEPGHFTVRLKLLFLP